MNDLSDEDLLAALGVEVEAEKPKAYTPLEARLIAGFEDILKFVEDHKRVPQHGEDKDIFERLYAVRLDQLRTNEQALGLLSSMDEDGLLQGKAYQAPEDDDALLAELGVESGVQEDITALKHVSPIAHRRAAEEVASREVCRDFDKFEPLFEQVKADLEVGVREAREGIKFEDINVGGFFILKGQLLYVAEKGEDFKAPNEQHWDARLRIVFDNGTESNMLLRSVLRRGVEDDLARTITTLNAGPLFNDVEENQTGIIYVLRSKSELPEILPIRDAIVKIGVTSGDVKTRLSGASKHATYLLGEVEIVDEYELFNINRNKLEKLLHHVFQDAQLQLKIPDRFGNPVHPKEWFFVTPDAVAKCVELIRSGEIKEWVYDAKSAGFERV